MLARPTDILKSILNSSQRRLENDWNLNQTNTSTQKPPSQKRKIRKFNISLQWISLFIIIIVISQYEILDVNQILFKIDDSRFGLPFEYENVFCLRFEQANFSPDVSFSQWRFLGTLQNKTKQNQPRYIYIYIRSVK